MKIRAAAVLAAFAAVPAAFGQCGSPNQLLVTEAYVVNGVPVPELTFVAGETYTFTCQNTSTHPFILTTHPDGGSGAQPLPMSMGVSCQCSACATCATTTITWNVPASLSGTFYYQCTRHHGMGNMIHIMSRPAISDQPDSQEVCTDGSFSLSVVADTSDHVALTYQWRLDGEPISGATGATYSVASATAAHSGSYDCVVSNGCVTTTSNVAVVTVGNCCPADFDGDGFITGNDYDLYVQAFEAGDLLADFDKDGFITGTDFDLYVQAFEAGC